MTKTIQNQKNININNITITPTTPKQSINNRLINHFNSAISFCNDKDIQITTIEANKSYTAIYTTDIESLRKVVIIDRWEGYKVTFPKINTSKKIILWKSY